MTPGVMIIGVLAGMLLLFSGDKKKPKPKGPLSSSLPVGPASPSPTALNQAMRSCIASAAPMIGNTILWDTPAQREAWAEKLAANGFGKAAQCVAYADGSADQVACMPLLNSAIEADLLAMATPLTSAAQFTGLAKHLQGAGFGAAAACFGP